MEDNNQADETAVQDKLLQYMALKIWLGRVAFALSFLACVFLVGFAALGMGSLFTMIFPVPLVPAAFLVVVLALGGAGLITISPIASALSAIENHITDSWPGSGPCPICEEDEWEEDKEDEEGEEEPDGTDLHAGRTAVCAGCGAALTPASGRYLHPKEITGSPWNGETGRNAPCPCGSSRKYKNCCGRGPVFVKTGSVGPSPN